MGKAKSETLKLLRRKPNIVVYQGEEQVVKRDKRFDFPTALSVIYGHKIGQELLKDHKVEVLQFGMRPSSGKLGKYELLSPPILHDEISHDAFAKSRRMEEFHSTLHAKRLAGILRNVGDTLEQKGFGGLIDVGAHNTIVTPDGKTVLVELFLDVGKLPMRLNTMIGDITLQPKRIQAILKEYARKLSEGEINDKDRNR